MTAEEVADEAIVATTKPAPETGSKPKKQPPYAVIIKNDEFHTFEYIIDGLSQICGYSQQKGHLLAVEIHTGGKAAVWRGRESWPSSSGISFADWGRITSLPNP